MNVANVLAVLVGVGIVVVGVRELVAPHGSAGFGIPGTRTEDPNFQAWLAVKAVRDIASGLFVFLLLVAAPASLLGWFMLVAAVIPAGDALIVWRSGGPRWAYLGVHGTTALVMLVAGVLLLAG